MVRKDVYLGLQMVGIDIWLRRSLSILDSKSILDCIFVKTHSPLRTIVFNFVSLKSACGVLMKPHAPRHSWQIASS